MAVVGCLQELPMADQHLAGLMGHHPVEGLTDTLPLGLLVGCTAVALPLEGLMDNLLPIHMELLSLDPTGQGVLERQTSLLV